nr:AraC family transcriptional regulator [Clostridia bacterium]
MRPYVESPNLPSLPIRCFTRDSRLLSDEAFVHPHWHDAIEVLYMVRGQTRQQADDRIFVAKPGDIVVVWSNQIHSTYWIGDEDCEIRVFQWAHHEIYENELIRRIGFLGPVGKDHDLWPLLMNLLDGIHTELEEKADGFEYQAKAYVYQFFATIIRNWTRLPIAARHSDRPHPAIPAIFDHVDNHYGEPLSLRQAADAVYLSIPHFMRVFKEATGMTFKAYLNRYRIDKATALLRQGCGTARAAELQEKLRMLEQSEIQNRYFRETL